MSVSEVIQHGMVYRHWREQRSNTDLKTDVRHGPCLVWLRATNIQVHTASKPPRIFREYLPPTPEGRPIERKRLGYSPTGAR